MKMRVKIEKWDSDVAIDNDDDEVDDAIIIDNDGDDINHEASPCSSFNTPPWTMPTTPSSPITNNNDDNHNPEGRPPLRGCTRAVFILVVVVRGVYGQRAQLPVRAVQPPGGVR